MSTRRDLDWARERLAGSSLTEREATQVQAVALVSIASSLEVIAECQSEQRAEARWFFEQNEGDYDDLFSAGGRYRPTAEVRSPLLMDVDHGHDEGAEVKP